MAGGPEAAAAERPRTLERLIDIDRTVNHSLQMLRRYPDLDSKIGQLMDDYVQVILISHNNFTISLFCGLNIRFVYLQALRSKDETPGSMLYMTPEAEAAILDKYRTEAEHKVAEKERIKVEEKMRKEQRGRQRTEARQERHRVNIFYKHLWIIFIELLIIFYDIFKVEAVLGKKMAGTFEQESLEDEDDDSLLDLSSDDTRQFTTTSYMSSTQSAASTTSPTAASPTSLYMDKDMISNTQENQV